MRVDVRIDKRLREAVESIDKRRLNWFLARCIEESLPVLQDGGKHGTFRLVVDVPDEIGERWDNLRLGNQKQALLIFHEVLLRELGGGQ